MVGIKETCSFQRAGKECQISLKHNKATGVDYVFFLYQSSAAFFNFIADIVQLLTLNYLLFSPTDAAPQFL